MKNIQYTGFCQRIIILPRLSLTLLCTLFLLINFAGRSTAGVIVFNETFSNNANGWNNIAASTDNGTIGIDPGGTGASVWYPSIDSDGEDVLSWVELPTPFDIADGPITVTFRVRGDSNSTDSNTFNLELVDDAVSRFARLKIRPSDLSKIGYRNSGGGAEEDDAGSVSFNNMDFSEFIDLRMILSDNGDGSMTINTYRNTSIDSGFTFIGNVTDADLNTGIFTYVNIFSRNGSSSNNRVYFDSINIIQGVPEPSTVALLILGSVLAVGFRRRRR